MQKDNSKDDQFENDSERNEESKITDDGEKPNIFELEDWLPLVAVYAFYQAQKGLQEMFSNERINAILDGYDSNASKILEELKSDKNHQSLPEFVRKTSVASRLNFEKDFLKLIETQNPEIEILRLIRKAINLGPDEGGKILIGDKAEDSLKRILQSERAKKPRKVTLKNLITKILIDFPGISGKDVLQKLENLTGQGVIDSINDESIVWNDENGRAHETGITSLPSIISRLKKNL
ncbi:MAG: hypothetical protein HOB18_10125 [Nitrospina sp.]|nr:hypothetical protein [Nitrospina sp.]